MYYGQSRQRFELDNDRTADYQVEIEGANDLVAEKHVDSNFALIWNPFSIQTDLQRAMVDLFRKARP